MNNLKIILRWVFFIPGAYVCSMIAYAVALLFFGGSSWLIGLPFYAPFNLLIAGGISGYAIILSGAYIAPTDNKKIPVVILIATSTLLGIGSLYIRIDNQEWFRYFEGLIVLIGVVIATYNIKNANWKV